MTAMLPRIAVLGTGGTISSLGASSLPVNQRLGRKLLPEIEFPETRLVADPRPVTLRQGRQHRDRPG